MGFNSGFKGLNCWERCLLISANCPFFISVQWFYCSRSDEEEEQSGASKNMHITSFFKQAGSNKRQKTKHAFFTVRNLDVLDSLWFECDVCLLQQNVHQMCWRGKNFRTFRTTWFFLLWKSFFFVHIFLYDNSHQVKQNNMIYTMFKLVP